MQEIKGRITSLFFISRCLLWIYDLALIVYIKAGLMILKLKVRVYCGD